MARPKLTDEEKRTRRVVVRFSEAEFELVAARARAEGNGDLSPFLRALVLGESPSTKRARKADHAHRQLMKILNNLDQLASALGGEDAERGLGKAQAIYRRLSKSGATERVSPDSVERLRAEGTMLNSLTRRANMGREIKNTELQECLHHVLATLRAIEEEAGRK